MSAASGRPSLSASLRATAPAWLASRALVLGAYLVASQAVAHGWIHKATAQSRIDQGLLGWDAGWYRAIAGHGYLPLGRESTRFFPLWPEMVRGVHLLGVPTSWALVGGASLLWWAALIAIDQLGGSLSFDARRRTTAIWLLCLVPGAVATVLGYSEPLLVVLVAAALAVVYRPAGRSSPSTGAWLVIAVLGALAGATRPVGVLLVIPIAIEAWRRRSTGVAMVASIVALCSPLLGAGAYLLWVRSAFGDALAPLKVQTEAGHHGSLTNPITGVLHGVSLAAHGHLGALLHLPWVAVALVAVALGVRKLPLSATVYAVGILALALGGQNLDSFERYLLAVPTLFLVAAGWLGRRTVRIGVLLVLAAGLALTSVLVFADYLVP